MCQDPVGHTSNSTVTTADGTTEHTEDEGLGVNICCSTVSSLSDRKQRWQELELPVIPLSEKNLAGRTGQPRTLWLRGAVRKQQETRRRGRWNIEVQFPEWWRWHSIFGTRGWFLPQKGFSLRKKYSPQQQNCVQLIFLYLRCYGTMKLPWPWPLVFSALVEIPIRFFDTDLSVIEV